MLELQGAATGLLDDPIALRVRGLGEAAGELRWRARLRDDDGRVWRASAGRPELLPAAFGADAPAAAPPVAALRSLRPVRIDVRAEAPDGRAVARALTRALVGDGVRVRRWRDLLPGAEATLHRPAATPVATVLLDATAGEHEAIVAALSAPLLASRGVLVLTVAPAAGRARRPAAQLLHDAADRLAEAVPGTPPPEAIEVIPPLLAPGIPARQPGDPSAWDGLLARLGARPRTSAAPPLR